MAARKRGKRRIITLIGIFAAGKTKIGKRLAKHLDIDFVDTDNEIVRHCGAECLHDVQTRMSASAFAKLEERIAIETLQRVTRPTIISTGGSVVFSSRAMQLFHAKTHVVNLVAPFKTIKKRVAKRPNRGIVKRKGESLRDVYDRRKPLYARYAHRTVDAGRSRKEAASALAKAIKKDRII